MGTLQPPPSLKPVSHYLKVAAEHDSRDPVIAYWARFAAVQKALSIDKSSPEAKQFVITLLDWLETSKRAHAGNEAITIEAAGEAHIENYALKLFTWADQSDRNAVFNKNVVKAFYTSGMLFDILESLKPPLSEEFVKARKYAKWKAAYIHNCLKNGETPIPGDQGEEDEEGDEGFSGAAGGAPQPFGFVKPASFDNTPNLPSVPQQQYPPSNPYGMPQLPQVFTPPGSTPAPPANTPASTYQDFSNTVASGAGGGGSGAALSFEQIGKAQKYCKWAGSALNFDDVNSAIENLEKALHLLKTGKDTG